MLIPSIDLMGGRIVQLVQGEKLRLAFDDFEYWIEKFSAFSAGAVDRPGRGDARRATTPRLWSRLPSGCPVQAGGGIHTIERARQVLNAGAKRVIIGSALFTPRAQ
jgi:phosphoribosylformimino-5-aminoimidazole carboxamide ribotide isomerase